MNKKRTIVGRVVLWLLAAMLCASMPAMAEATERGDLSERFGNISTIEYNGVTYRVRNRITVALIMGTVGEGDSEAPGSDYAELMYLLVLDDDQKIYTPIRLNSVVWTGFAGNELWPEGEAQLRAMYSMGENSDAGCVLIRQAVDEILGEQLVGGYAALDLDRLTAIDGIEPSESYVESEYKDRLRAIKAKAEQSSTDEINAMFNALSGYIVTDMKSGALMKIVDKMERYEGHPTVALPVIEEQLENGEIKVVVDEAAVLPAVLDVFYEEYTGW